jgi:hypothetical protein
MAELPYRAQSVLQHILNLFGVIADTISMAPGNFVYLAAVAVYVILAIGALWMQNRDHMKRLEQAAEMKHKASHLLRNKHFDLRRLYLDEGIQNNAKIKAVRNELENTGKEFVTYVAELLSSLSKHDVNVCIKAIEEPRQRIASESEDWKNVFVYTLCRSPKSKDRPKSAPKRVSVAENTDFLRIMRDDGDIFYAPDLVKYHKMQRKLGDPDGYLNSTNNWTDYYRSTIVAPIRIEASRIGVDHARYDLLGFLCADSMSTKAFPDRYKVLYSQLMLSFGDDLYRYFYTVTEISDKMTENRKRQVDN